MKTLLLILTLALLSGCSTGRFKTSGGTTLTAPKDASSPSYAKEGQRVVKAELGAGSVVVKEKIEATPQSPAIERETITYSKATERVETEAIVEVAVSPVRAPDQTVALRKADNSARAPMLYASILCVFLCGLFLYRGKVSAAVVFGSIAAALALLWYSFGNVFFMAAAFVLAAAGIAFSIWRQQKKAQLVEEALRRTVQTVEEIGIDKPSVASEIHEYQSSNLDSEHKKLIQEIRPTISYKYIRERIAKTNPEL